jgi:uncharacterized spore protein YtfJ
MLKLNPKKMKNLNNKTSEQVEKFLTVEDLVADPIRVRAREILRGTVKFPRTDRCNCAGTKFIKSSFRNNAQ